MRADRSLSPPQVDRIRVVINDAFAALHEIHALGIIHRGLTPDRVFVDNARVRFCDFFAARIQEKQTIASVLGDLVDLDSFIAPELLLDVPRTTQATDVFCLGASLWYWITGIEPEPLKACPRLIALRPDIPVDVSERLDALLSRCMSLDESARPDASTVSI